MKGLLLGLLPLGILANSSCYAPTRCDGLITIGLTQPDTATIKIGAAIIAIAGESYGSCGDRGQPPPHDYVWTISDSTVVSVTPLDSVHARINGLRAGRATVTPRYRAGMSTFINSIGLTVVP